MLRRLSRSHQLALTAAAEALESLPFDLPSPDRCAVSVGVGYGASDYTETQLANLDAKGWRGVNPLAIPLIMPNSIASHLSIQHGFTGPALTHAGACAAGTIAIGEAMWLLRNNRADLVLAGGVDALLSPGVMSFFARMGAMSTNYDSPDFASRPFDVDRDGFVLGEGAAFVVLTRSNDRTSTTADRYGQLLGYGASSDAHHLVAPPSDGRGAAASMRAALADADLTTRDIGHINAHGTSTLRNDLAEAQAIDAMFSGHHPAVTANKGATGHMIGASGAFECIATSTVARTGICPPIVGLRTIDPSTPVDLVAHEQRQLSNRIGLSNSFAFGGHNATLIVGS